MSEAQPPTGQARPPRTPLPVSAVLAAVIPVLCLAGFGFGYVSIQRDLAAIRESQRQLVEEVAAMRKTPIIDVQGAPARGSADAIVTLIEYSDYECPYCIAHFQRTAPSIDAAYIRTGKIRYVFRDFPVDENHPEAIRAHVAARCAGEQGRFWDMHARLFSAPGTHTPFDLATRANETGLDMTAYASCVESGRPIEDIRRVSREATALGANGTPAFFFGLRDPATDQVRIMRGVTGAQPLEVFQKTIDALLEQIR